MAQEIPKVGEADEDQRFLPEDIVELEIPVREGKGEADDERSQSEGKEPGEIRADEGKADPHPPTPAPG